jgi:hypothetical protein
VVYLFKAHAQNQAFGTRWRHCFEKNERSCQQDVMLFFLSFLSPDVDFASGNRLLHAN